MNNDKLKERLKKIKERNKILDEKKQLEAELKAEKRKHSTFWNLIEKVRGE